MKIPLADLKTLHEPIKAELQEAMTRVLERGNFVMGEEVEAFEEEWARHCGTRYAVGVASCTSALYLVLRWLKLLGLTKVVTTPITFFATAEAALLAGMQVRFRDVEPETGLLCWNDSDLDACAGRNEIPLAVHIYGERTVFAKNEYPTLVEDASHAHMTKPRGLAACYSFYPTKSLGAFGQAGAVATNDEALAAWLRRARRHGEDPAVRFTHLVATGNHRMDELQAAVLRVKLPYLGQWTNRRREIAARYIKEMGLGPFPHDRDHENHIFALYVRRGRRDELAAFLNGRGIQTAVHYPPLHLQPALSLFHWSQGKGTLPYAEEFGKATLSLPCHAAMTDEQVEYVVLAVDEWLKRERERRAT